MNPSDPQSLSLARRWLPFAVVAAVWLIVATRQIALPGVYMDAVNPDYLAVRVLNPHAEPITAWLLAGNYIHGKYPFLISLYHGSQQFWLGLPFFWLFGTTVAGLRLTHAMFGLFVLAAMYAVLGRGGLKPWQAVGTCALLALDPGFLYAFRTQSYITLAPTAWLFLSLYFLQRGATQPEGKRGSLMASGTVYGLAVVGYFIYSFYLPAMLLAVVLWSRSFIDAADRRIWRRWWLPWFIGLALGGSAYVIGYALVASELGGVREAWAYFANMQQGLHAFGTQATLPQRFAHLAAMIEGAAGGAYPHALMFGDFTPLPMAGSKLALLLGLSLALWLLAETQHRATILLRVLIALPVSFVVIAQIFGARLAGHHFVPLLPLFYSLLAVALCSPVGLPDALRRGRSALQLGVLVVLAGINLAGQLRESELLAQTRGSGLFSDAINKLAADLNTQGTKPFVYFPDWGLSMPVAFLTRGTVGMDSAVNIKAARGMLCDGRNVAVAVITGDRTSRIDAWQSELLWTEPARVAYRQGDGKIVFELATFSGDRTAPGC